MTEYEQYEKWENEEWLVNSQNKLQWKKDPEYPVWTIRLIAWAGSSCETEDIWEAEECEIEVLCEIEVFFDGPRHYWFKNSTNRYLYYTDPLVLSKGFNRVYELAQTWGCYDWL